MHNPFRVHLLLNHSILPQKKKVRISLWGEHPIFQPDAPILTLGTDVHMWVTLGPQATCAAYSLCHKSLPVGSVSLLKERGSTDHAVCKYIPILYLCVKSSQFLRASCWKSLRSLYWECLWDRMTVASPSAHTWGTLPAAQRKQLYRLCSALVAWELSQSVKRAAHSILVTKFSGVRMCSVIEKVRRSTLLVTPPHLSLEADSVGRQWTWSTPLPSNARWWRLPARSYLFSCLPWPSVHQTPDLIKPFQKTIGARYSFPGNKNKRAHWIQRESGGRVRKNSGRRHRQRTKKKQWETVPKGLTHVFFIKVGVIEPY